MNMRIIIIGGGVCGLAIAWRLAQTSPMDWAGERPFKQKCTVTIFDQGPIGQAASWAAAGMLNVVEEAEPGGQALWQLGQMAQTQWPSFAQELEQATNQKIDYTECGLWLIAPDADGVRWLQQRQKFQQAIGYDLPWLDRQALHAQEPYLAPRVQAALHSANDHQVDNRKLVQALSQACRQAGGLLYENTPIEKITIENGKVSGVETAASFYGADQVIVCAGAWSGQIKGITKELLPPVYPLKGQMLAVQMNPAQPLLTHIITTPDIYMVPRRDGRLLIGATVEDQGFDVSVTAGGLRHLLEKAWWVLPGIEELPIVETWAGLRPSSPDDAPILGPSGLPGLSYATGHHRNGILLAPVTGDLLTEYILSGEVPAAMQPFLASRFRA